MIPQAIADHWVFKYGVPKTVLTDNARELKKGYMAEFNRIIGCKSVTTSTYHPQTNGQTERFNRTILAALRTYVGENVTNWDMSAQTLTFAYNTQVHSSTG